MKKKGDEQVRYCPYCGVGLTDETYTFCLECGKQIPDKEGAVEDIKTLHEKEKSGKNRKSIRRKRERESMEREKSEVLEDGYDGYYDDILPVDEGKIKQGIDKDMLKRIVGLVIGVFITICACVAIMYMI